MRGGPMTETTETSAQANLLPRDEATDPKPKSPWARNCGAILFGGLALMTGLGSLEMGLWLAGVFGIGATGLAWLLTSWGKQWRTEGHFAVPGPVIGGLAVVLFITAGGMAGTKSEALLEQRFAETGDQQIAVARKALKAGDTSAASAAIEPFLTLDDSRIKALELAISELKEADGDREKAARTLLAVRQAVGGDVSRYTQAIEDLAPENLKALEAEAADRVKQVATAAEEAVDQERLKAHFSSWDGSHPAVVEAVKRSMHDPSSFKHVETTAKGRDDTIIVSMTYRGTNGFGGVVTNHVVAVVDTDGNLKSIASDP